MKESTVRAPRDTRPKSKPIPYSESEMSMLARMWPAASTKEIKAAFPARSMVGIKQKAYSMGLKSDAPKSRKGSLEPLLNGTPEAFYWLGFFLADGHLTKGGHLLVSVIDEETSHLDRFSSFVGSPVRTPYGKVGKKYALSSFMTEAALRKKRRFAVQDPHAAQRIRTLLGLVDSNKTFNPPSVEALRKLDSRSLEFLFVGFFDGDGSTTTTKFGGKLENHASWKKVYGLFEECGLITNYPHTGTASGYVPRNRMISLSRSCLDAGVPTMRRKWSKWDLLAQRPLPVQSPSQCLLEGFSP